MKKLLAIIGITLLWAGSAGATVVVRRAAAGGALAVETVGGTISSGTLTTTNLSFTTTADTDVLLVYVAFRRNASQTVSAITYNGFDLVLSTQNPNQQMRTQIWYTTATAALSAGTHNISITMSASVPGFGMSAISLKNSANPTPVDKFQNTTQSVTTSSATFNSISVGDISTSLLCKQDASTSEPTLNTSGAVLQVDFDFNSGGAGNGGHFKVATRVATTTSDTLNFSWSSAANHGHVGSTVVQ